MLRFTVAADGVGIVVLGAGDPLGESHLRRIGPAKRSGRDGLVAAVDPDGVVSGRAAKPIAPARVSDVGVRAGIDEQARAAAPDDQAESVGMAVAAALRSKRAGVEDDLYVRMGHADHTSVGKQARFDAGSRQSVWR